MITLEANYLVSTNHAQLAIADGSLGGIRRRDCDSTKALTTGIKGG